MRLCKGCAETERKENAGRQDGPGLWSYPMPRITRCENCSSPANGFKICAGCAVEAGHCQGCYVRIAASPLLLSEVAAHRQACKQARDAAEELYAQTIEPFKDEAAAFRAAIAASEAQRNADCESFWEAERVTREAYDRTSFQTPEAERREKCDAMFVAKKASEENFSRQFEAERERNAVLRSNFAGYKVFAAAAEKRKRTIERALSTFEAAVDRSITIARAQAVFQEAVAKADESYARSMSLQDALDGILSKSWQ